MKAFALKILVFGFSVCFVGSAFADTPLKLGAEFSRIEGVARSSTSVSAIVFYSPAYKFDKSLSSRGCEFVEDRWKPNDNDMSVTLKASPVVDGKYSLSIPTAGQRGECAYVLESVSLFIEDQPASQNLTLLTQRQIERMNSELSEVVGIESVQEFSALTALYCEFKTEFETGFCYPAQDSLAFYYGISNSPTDYTLDLKDISEKPARQY